MRTLDEVLRQFGLANEAIAPIRSGRVNRHWRVGFGQTLFILRRYRRERSNIVIQYEHEVLEHAMAHGWPVAPAIRAMNGQRVVEVNGRRYSLFHRLIGRRVSYSNIERNSVNGGLLARFHDDMTSWDSAIQREGFETVSELDVPTQALTRYSTFNEMLHDFEQEHRDLGNAIRATRYENLQNLSRLGYGSWSPSLIHGDFQYDNLLFKGGTLTGLLDFDFVHVDERVADVSASIALDCLAPPAKNELRLEAVGAFIRGYVRVSPLSSHEIALIPPLIQAALLRLITFQMCGWSLGGGEEALRSIERSVRERLSSLRKRAPLLEDAIQREVL